MKIWRSVLSLCFACLIGQTTSHAQDLQYYNVEILLFAHSRPNAGSERWPAQTLAAEVENAVDLASAPKLNVRGYVFTRLGNDALQLRAKADALHKSANYEVLLHTAWRQPGLSDNQAIAVHLHALPFNYPVLQRLPRPWVFKSVTAPDAHYQQWPRFETETAVTAIPEEIPAAQPDAQVTRALPADEIATPTELKYVRYGLDGTLTLVRSRYLHVYTDLVYTAPRQQVLELIERVPDDQLSNSTNLPTEPAASAAPGMQSFRYQLHRRMRSKELHYLDHPVMGMLILVTPINEEE